MLVLSRERGTSVVIDGPEGGCRLTVLEIRGDHLSLLVSHTPSEGKLQSWTTELVRDKTVKIGSTADVILIDIRGEISRLAIIASKRTSVHRLEVYEAMRREIRDAARAQRPHDDPEDGLAGSRVPRPDQPKPPTLDVRLDEPPSDSPS